MRAGRRELQLRIAVNMNGILVGETTYRASSQANEYRESGRGESEVGADPRVGSGRGALECGGADRSARAARRPALAGASQ